MSPSILGPPAYAGPSSLSVSKYNWLVSHRYIDFSKEKNIFSWKVSNKCHLNSARFRKTVVFLYKITPLINWKCLFSLNMFRLKAGSKFLARLKEKKVYWMKTTIFEAFCMNELLRLSGVRNGKTHLDETKIKTCYKRFLYQCISFYAVQLPH